MKFSFLNWFKGPSTQDQLNALYRPSYEYYHLLYQIIQDLTDRVVALEEKPKPVTVTKKKFTAKSKSKIRRVK